MSIRQIQPLQFQSMTGLTVGDGTSLSVNEITANIVNFLVSLEYNGSPITTDQVIEGLLNLYFTNARARLAISSSNTIGASGITISYNNITGVISATILNPQISINSTVIQLGSNSSINTTAIWNADQLQGFNISSVAPTNGQLLLYNSGTSMWTATSVTVTDAESIWTRAIHDSVPSDRQVLIWNNGSSYWQYDHLIGTDIYDNTKTNAGQPQFGKVSINGSLATNSTLTQNLASASDSLFINGNGTSTPTSGASCIQLTGAGSGFFQPSYWNYMSGTNQSNTYFINYIPSSIDTGTNPVCRFICQYPTNANVVTRPLFSFENFITQYMLIDANGFISCKATTGAFSPNILTNAQEVALSASNGMMCYNSTTNLFNFRENGVWNSRTTGAFIISNNLSEGTPVTMRSNLGLGSFAILNSPATTNGDTIYYNSSAYQRLAIGSNEDRMTISSSLPAWKTPQLIAGNLLPNTHTFTVNNTTVSGILNVFTTTDKSLGGITIVTGNAGEGLVFNFSQTGVYLCSFQISWQAGSTSGIWEMYLQPYNGSGTTGNRLLYNSGNWSSNSNFPTSMNCNGAIYVTDVATPIQYKLVTFQNTGGSQTLGNNTNNQDYRYLVYKISEV